MARDVWKKNPVSQDVKKKEVVEARSPQLGKIFIEELHQTSSHVCVSEI